MSEVSDPFQEARQKDGILKCPFQGENLPMILRHADGARPQFQKRLLREEF